MLSIPSRIFTIVMEFDLILQSQSSFIEKCAHHENILGKNFFCIFLQNTCISELFTFVLGFSWNKIF